jgi:hypothetical protein
MSWSPHDLSISHWGPLPNAVALRLSFQHMLLGGKNHNNLNEIFTRLVESIMA